MTTLPEFGPVKIPVAPVLRKDGDFERVPWLGYLERDDAAKHGNAKPVKLDVVEYSVAPGEWPPRWRRVPEGMAVQGCLTAEGVFAVVEDGMPRLVSRQHKFKA